jgi:predicted flavoprotein YhiN
MSVGCDVAIIGGSAAGLICAIGAGRRGRRVVVFGHNPWTGRKILISGGVRCIFTNLRAGDFRSRNPLFAKSAPARYPPADVLAMVERHGFPTTRSRSAVVLRPLGDVTGMMEAECAAAGVRIVTGCKVERVGADLEVATSEGAFRPQT